MSNEVDIKVENENVNPSNDASVVEEHSIEVVASGNLASTSNNENNPNDISNARSTREKNDKPNDISKSSEADLFDKIQRLHCPFTWKPEDHLKSYKHDEIQGLLDVDEMFDDTGFKLRRFVIHLILCYSNFSKRLIEDSIRSLDEMEKMLLTSMKNKSRDVYFTSINDALFHIMQSCRVYMLNETNQKDKALQVLRKITPYDELNDRNKAGIWAVRANLYVEFGHLGVRAAIEYIKKATSIDDENPYWYFTKGMYLGRLRRLENGLAVPSVDEIAALELAMKLKEDASFMAFAAEVYTETANRSLKQFKELLFNCKESEKNELLKQNDVLNKHAAMLFKKSVSLNSNCAHLLFRCGKGLLKLPPPHQDLKLAQEFIKKGLEISYESSFGNHAMAMYYEKHKKNFEMAKKYLTKASEQRNFGADIDLIRIDFLENRDPEALRNNLMKLFDLYPDKLKHRKITAEIISYYLFVSYNLTEAINYMKKLMYLSGDHDDIINIYKSGILRQKLPVSLLEILLSDITDRSNKKNLTSDEQELCKTFLNQLCFQSFDLPVPNSQNLRKKVVSEIKANFKNIQLQNIKPSSKKTQTHKENPRKDYNPVESRFNKEYARKYYYEAEKEQPQKTVVDEFFEKYEEEMKTKKNTAKREPLNEEKSVDHKKSNVEKKSKDSAEMHPRLQEIFSKLRSSKTLNLNSSAESEDEDEVVFRLAKQFERRFDVDDRSLEKKSKDHSLGTGKSNRRKSRDDSRSERRSNGRDKKRSGSRESCRSTKTSNGKRSTSRDSHTSHSSRRKRSKSRDTHISNSSHKKRSVSRETHVSYRKKRSVSRNRHLSSRRKRSESRESHASSRRKRSASRENHVSRRKRSVSRETSRRDRSLSRESRKSTGKQRSRSLESNRSTRSDRHTNQKSNSTEVSKDPIPSTSEERSHSRHGRHSDSRSPSNRHRNYGRKDHDYDRKYRSQKSRESSSRSETSRSPSRSPTRSHKKRDSRRDREYDSSDTLKDLSPSDSAGSDSGRSKRSSRNNHHRRHKRYGSHRSSKSPAKRSDSRESHRTRHKHDRYRMHDSEEKYEKRHSREKYQKSYGSDRDLSDRTDRSGSCRLKDSHHQDRRRNDEKDHRLNSEKLSKDSNDIERSASRSSHSENLHVDEDNVPNESK